MYQADFKEYLSEKTGIDVEVIDNLFQNQVDIFKIALELIENHGIDEGELGKIWGDYLGYAYVDPNKTIVNKEFVEKVGVQFIKDNSAMPLYKFGRAVTVCTSNPHNPYIQDKLEKKLGEIVSFVFCFPFDIEIYLKFNNVK